MVKKVDRIIIDTNLWISFLISKSLRGLDQRIKHGDVQLLFSPELIQEFLDVIARPKFRKFFNKEDVARIFELIEDFGIIIEPTTDFEICRDAKDNFLLSLAFDSRATHLLTGDKDLLDLLKFKKTKIMTITDYLKGR